MRHAILDADDDGAFDDADLGLFPERYFDGFTGGPGTAPFDLDLIGSPPRARPALGRVFQQLDEGGGVFFEAAGVTDLAILCYYAHSGLYQGTPAARAALVDRAWCNPVEVDVSRYSVLSRRVGSANQQCGSAVRRSLLN